MKEKGRKKGKKERKKKGEKNSDDIRKKVLVGFNKILFFTIHRFDLTIEYIILYNT